MTAKITTTVTIFAVFLSPVTSPYAAADAGTVEDYYWHSDTDMCYSESSLDDLDFNDSTGNGDDVIDEMEKSRSTYNDESNVSPPPPPLPHVRHGLCVLVAR